MPSKVIVVPEFNLPPCPGCGSMMRFFAKDTPSLFVCEACGSGWERNPEGRPKGRLVRVKWGKSVS